MTVDIGTFPGTSDIGEARDAPPNHSQLINV